MKKSILLFFLIASAYFIFFSPIARASSDHIWINQVQVEGDGGANDEFIELFNPTDSAVSLDGWSLQYKSSAGNFPLVAGKKNLPVASIPAYGYFLVAT